MGMDPKQRRALAKGRANESDHPRDTSRAEVRAQEGDPPGADRKPPRRRTAAMQGDEVNIQGDTPVERLARRMGERRIGEVGRTATLRERRREEDRAGNEAGSPPANGTVRGRRDRGPALTPDLARETLIARREHSKGDGNLPDPEPHADLVDERPEDRMPRDLPKERDDRSAPKGNVTHGQRDRNRGLEARDDHDAGLPAPKSGFERAQEAAEEALRPRRRASGTRPNARRSSSAKRKVTTRPRQGSGRAKANVRQAPKDAARSGRRAAIQRRPQVGKRRTGTAPRGDAVSRIARGNVSARKAGKAKPVRARERRERARKR